MQKLDNFVEIKNENFSAVFVNNNTIPVKIIPLKVYSLIGGLSELCQYDYLFDDIVTYSILKWESRESKDEYSLSLMTTNLEQQKAFKNLIK